jgi:DNA-binding transcriptional MerR regulator
MQELAIPGKTKANKSLVKELPSIPDKLYFTIGEVAKLCAVKTHVLRFWEQEFAQLRPNKRRGNRRYYQREDILLLRKIRDLLYFQGFTIEGARINLAAQGKQVLAALSHEEIFSELLSKLQGLLVELEYEYVTPTDNPR